MKIAAARNEHDALEGARPCRARVRPPAAMGGNIMRTIGIE
jgi:hypothetical protein